MDRRTFLALLAAGTAGCTGGEETATETPTPSSTRRPTPTAIETSTATETPTATGQQGASSEANENDEQGSQQGANETDEETATETATPSDEEVAAKHLDSVAEHLRAAVETYVEPTGSGDWLAVDGSHEVDDRRVETELRAAEAELETAADHAVDDQANRVAHLKHLVGYVRLVVDVHVSLHDAWVALRDANPAARKESFDAAATAVETATAAVADAADGIRTLRDDSRPIAAKTTSVLSRDGYKAKIDELAAEQATADAITGVPEEIEDGMVEFADASEDFKNEDYGHAAVKYWAAWEAFEDGLEDLPDDPSNPYDGIVEDQRCFLEALYVAAKRLETASQHRRNPGKEREALEALEGCDLVSDSPTASQVRDTLRDAYG